MQIGKYIHARLSADAAIGAIVGTGANAKIHPVFLPQGTNGTGIVYLVKSQPHGIGKVEEGTHIRSTVTLHLWADYAQGAEAYPVLEALDLAVYEALNYIDATAGGVTVESCRHIETADGRDEQNMYYLKTALYEIVHRR